MSRGKNLIALSLLTFIALVVVGATYSGHHGDTTGATPPNWKANPIM